MQALVNSDAKVNIMRPACVLKPGFSVCRTNVRALKINDSTLKIFEIVLANFQGKDKLQKALFL